MEKLELKAVDGLQEIIIREGIAPENFKVRKGISINGTIGLPLAHLEKDTKTKVYEEEIFQILEIKKIIDESYLTIDRDKMVVEFVENAGKDYQSNYKGELQLHPDFNKWQINTSNSWTPLQLAEFIKMNRSSFESKTEAMKLVSTLMGFEAKVDKEVEAKADERANRKVLLAQTVTTNIPEGFKLKLPIFKGESAQLFEVEIGIDPMDLSCRLISPEVNDIVNDVKNTILDEQKDKIKELHPSLRIFEI